MTVKVCILDYGSGNVKSVFNLLSSITDDVKISNDISIIEKATHLILPGVGAFGASMSKIKKKLPLDIIENEVFRSKKPFLGICVGMQVLAEKGFEFGEYDGLGWLSGNVIKIDSKDKPLPHIGWNDIQIKHPSPLLHNFDNNQDFYFAHSYAFKTLSDENILATTNYGEEFISAANKENIFGVQFHPEKSQKAGKMLMLNFLSLR
jgi:glutamine amidotransferase